MVNLPHIPLLLGHRFSSQLSSNIRTQFLKSQSEFVQRQGSFILMTYLTQLLFPRILNFNHYQYLERCLKISNK